VGASQPIEVDVRVIAATHQDLAGAVQRGAFRADLLFRLNVFPIRVPPLRERRDDIADLARPFAHQVGRRMTQPTVPIRPAAPPRLLDYGWPGNVRELENIVERSMIVTTGDSLQIDPQWLRAASVDGPSREASQGLADLERRAILEALERCRGKIYGSTGAAAALGLKPTTLYGKMRKHQIPRSTTTK